MFGITRLVNFGAFDLYRLAFKEFSFLDTYYAEKLNSDEQKISQSIVLVNVQHQSRAQLANLIELVQQQKPKVIGVDVIFDHEKEPITDEKLWEALQPENVISAFAIQNRQFVKNDPKLGVFRHKLGYANFNFDSYNAVIRTFQAKKIFDGFEFSSFPHRVAQHFLGRQRKIEWKNISDKSIPINYSGGRQYFLTFDADEILESKSLPVLANKIVLLGYLGTPTGNVYDIEDKHFTPLNQEFVGKSAPDTFGLVIHANIIEMLVEQKRLIQVPVWVLLLVGFVLTFVAISYFIKLNKRRIERYMLVRKLTQLCFTIFFVILALWLLSNNIYFKITELIWYTVLSIECIWAYKILSNYMKNKFGWESYFFQD
ncbi:CHASE2 domain-containing protein [Muricauda sp. DJ-13]|uniref:CHASE2 domain-containing protein n=2 Tax=Croceivirga thetidis TaxID=2721623 RepID=A0ABX1GM68_9FLAO|nr:CHASE2 domain-containing protein [Croceivirga thetidis]